MKFLGSYLFFVLLIAFVMVSEGGNLLWLFDAFWLLMVLCATLFLGIGATSFQAAKYGFLLTWKAQKEPDLQLVSGACEFLQITGKFALPIGVAGTAIGWMLLWYDLDPNLVTRAVPATTTTALPLLYGILFKLLCYGAEMKISIQYFEEA